MCEFDWSQKDETIQSADSSKTFSANPESIVNDQRRSQGCAEVAQAPPLAIRILMFIS